MTPEEYRKRIAEYQGYIREGMTKWNVSALESMMCLAGKLKDRPIVQAGLFAAYVEMSEVDAVGVAVESALDRERRSSATVRVSDDAPRQ